MKISPVTRLTARWLDTADHQIAIAARHDLLIGNLISFSVSRENHSSKGLRVCPGGRGPQGTHTNWQQLVEDPLASSDDANCVLDVQGVVGGLDRSRMAGRDENAGDRLVGDQKAASLLSLAARSCLLLSFNTGYTRPWGSICTGLSPDDRRALCFSPDGTLYATTSGNHTLHTVDLGTGDLTAVGSISSTATGQPVDRPAGLASAPNGTLYLMEDGVLHLLDPVTAVGTPLGPGHGLATLTLAQ